MRACYEGTGGEDRKISWRMALYLEGKIPVDANDLSPKEATEMSRDIKYIGMDVHKEATVIAVRNGSGKLVMESIVETKASSILQFMHGLHGELHVTWEEGPGQPGYTICCSLMWSKFWSVIRGAVPY